MRPSEQYEAAWTLANEAVDDARSWRVRWQSMNWRWPCTAAGLLKLTVRK